MKIFLKIFNFLQHQQNTVRQWDINDEIETKRKTFSSVSGIDVEKTISFNAELEIPFQQF